MGMSAKKGLQIGELATRCGCTTRTIRYYEQYGLLAPSDRMEGGFRLYEEDAVDRIQRIQELKRLLGFSLEEVRSVIAAEDRVKVLREQYHSESSHEARRRVVQEALALAETRLALINRRIAGLTTLQAELSDKIARYHELLAELLDTEDTSV